MAGLVRCFLRQRSFLGDAADATDATDATDDDLRQIVDGPKAVRDLGDVDKRSLKAHKSPMSGWLLSSC